MSYDFITKSLNLWLSGNPLNFITEYVRKKERKRALKLKGHMKNEVFDDMSKQRRAKTTRRSEK